MTKLKRLFVSSLCVFLVLVVASWVYTWFAEPVPLHHTVVAAQIQERGFDAQAAYHRYPALTEKLFSLYGQESRFTQMWESRFGYQQTFPIIGKCFAGGDDFLEAQSVLKGALADLLDRKLPTKRRLTPEHCGQMMIDRINAEGDLFLARFYIDKDGVAHRLPLSSITSGVYESMTKGFQDLERDWVAPDRRVTASDVGGAALDAVGFWGAGKLAFVAKDGLRYAAVRTGLFDISREIAPKAIKYGVYGGMAYMALTHPAVLTGFGGWVASLAGVSPLWGQALVWVAVLYPLLALLNAIRIFFLPFRLVLRRRSALPA